jgi:hypothetical protein
MTQAPAEAQRWSRAVRLKEENRLVLRDIKQRLTLALARVDRRLEDDLRLQPEEILPVKTWPCSFWGTRQENPARQTSEETREWLAKESKILDYRDQPSKDVDKGLQSFETRLLVNTEEEDLSDAKAEMRQIGKGIWNNVVPYGKHEGDYGRNFAIGTGRKHVLHSIDGGTFDPVNKPCLLRQHLPNGACVFHTVRLWCADGRDPAGTSLPRRRFQIPNLMRC